MRRSCSWLVGFVVATALLPSGAQGKDVPTWVVGDQWTYREVITITGEAFPLGWVILTDWQNWQETRSAR